MKGGHVKAFKCLKVSGGLVVLIDLGDYKIESITEKDIKILIAESGMTINIGKINVIVPENLFEYFLSNNTITIYPLTLEKYVEEPALSVKISKDAISEAKGAYNFWRVSKNNGEKSIPV
jgi:hypothetical protein